MIPVPSAIRQLASTNAVCDNLPSMPSHGARRNADWILGSRSRMAHASGIRIRSCARGSVGNCIAQPTPFCVTRGFLVRATLGSSPP